MDFGVKTVEPTGWRWSGWRSCKDVQIPGVMENTPRYLRCMRCFRLVTHGETRLGGCVCGYRKMNPANSLSWGEILLLKLGWFPLDAWERSEIHPLAMGVCFPIRNKCLRMVPMERTSDIPKEPF
jgi:hypothetical protein